jgi:hypothetical protein
MITNILIGIVLFLQSFWLGVLPTDLPYISYDIFDSYLITAGETISGYFGFIAKFFPMETLFTFLIMIMVLEVVLLGFKSIRWVINITRGSGG